MTSFATRSGRARPDLPATCTIRLTVDAASATDLRRLALRVCGEALEFMRIAICAGSARIQVWMCVRRPVAALLRESVMRQMPDARLQQVKDLPGDPL